MRAIPYSDGETIDFTPPADVEAGDVVVIGQIVGVAHEAIPAGTRGGVRMRGAYSVAKAVGEGSEIPAGAHVFWDPDAKVASTRAAERSVSMGLSLGAAAFDDLSVLVVLR